ncbi:hypothetical protein CN217_12645 [Sinorhizobium meliloti]|uniref:hypothetical protein n=1 Tax=Rhizobium meliloti TaxID=382 RepID=UPI000FD19070|nr:hypothetical protein [Sinorhizobium meliloti]RVH12086.1 hypothetical protein CN217_12645 [Sinorhizobium meliloti]
MRAHGWFFCVAALASMSDGAFAESDVCVEMAHAIGMSSQKFLDVDQAAAVREADICEKEWSKASSEKKLQIEASYKLLSGSLDAGAVDMEERQKEVCKGEYGDTWRRRITNREALSLSNEAASLLTACLELSSNSLRPRFKTANVNEVTFSVQYMPSVVAELNIKQFGPSNYDDLDCTITKDNSVVKVKKVTDTSQSLKPSDSVSLNCRRQIKKKEIEGVTYQCTDEEIFTIATSGTVQSIKIPRECTEEIGPSRADQLEAKVNQLSQSIDERLRGLERKLSEKAQADVLDRRVAELSEALGKKVNTGEDLQLTNQLGSCLGAKKVTGGNWPVELVYCDSGDYRVWQLGPKR